MGTWCKYMLHCSNITGIKACSSVAAKSSSLTLITCLSVFTDDQPIGQVLALAPMRPAMELGWTCTNW